MAQDEQSYGREEQPAQDDFDHPVGHYSEP
jgi:hypothetical protein